LHHTFTDGLGAVKLAAELFEFERRPPTEAAAGAPGSGRPGPVAPGPRAGQPGRAGRADRRGPVGQAWDDARFEAERTLGLARRFLPWAASGVRDAVVDPRPRAQASLALLESMQALVRSAGGGPSPMLAGRGAGARLGALEFPLAELHQAGRRAEGTINDVLLAAALGGLRLYHAKRGSHPPSIRIGVPVSTRGGATEHHLRNQFTPVLVRAPLQLLDPVERVRLLHELVLAARQAPALGLLEPATAVLRRLPGSVRLAAGLLGRADLMVSNVAGSPVDLYLGEAKVDHLVAVGPRGGAGLNLTLVSHVGTAHVGVNMDPVAIPDSDVLLDCLQAGFDEVLG
jgi:hypothetical protein